MVADFCFIACFNTFNRTWNSKINTDPFANAFSIHCNWNGSFYISTASGWNEQLNIAIQICLFLVLLPFMLTTWENIGWLFATSCNENKSGSIRYCIHRRLPSEILFHFKTNARFLGPIPIVRIDLQWISNKKNYKVCWKFQHCVEFYIN